MNDQERQELVRELDRLRIDVVNEFREDFRKSFESFRADMNAGFARIIRKMDQIIEVTAELRKERA